MARLDDIREELYKKKPNLPSDAIRRPLAFPQKSKKAAGPEVSRNWENPTEEEPALIEQNYMSKIKQRRTALKILIFTGIAVVLAAAAFFVWKTLLPSSSIEFTVVGPNEIVVGEPTALTVRIINRSGVALKEGVVSFTLPAGSFSSEGGGDSSLGPVRQKLKIDDIAADGEFRKEMQVKFLGSLGQGLAVEGSFIYRPENVQSYITEETKFNAVIARVPLAIAVDVPDKVNSGQEVTMTIGVDSELSVPLPDMALGVDLPSGFTLISADPPAAEGSDTLWLLGDLVSGASKKVVIRGKVRGEPEEAKMVHVRLGRYAAKTKTWLVATEVSVGPTIASPFLLAQTSLNGARGGSLAPGSRVTGNVLFKNNLPQKIQNLTVNVFLPEKFIKLETVRTEKGFYDVTKKAVVWNPSSESRLRELDPSEEGTLTFSFELKDTLPIKVFADKNFAFPVVTSIDSGSPPPEYRGVSLEYRDNVEFKIESRLSLSARAAYYDSPVENSGSLPPKVRRATTYTIYLQLSSGANDLRDVEVKGQLGGGVEWKNSISTDIGDVGFNSATHEITWRIPKLTAATGILRSPVAAVFQVTLIPADNQVNTSPTLISGLAASGIDVFTDTTKTDTAESLTTELRTDARTTFDDWRVVR